MFKINENILTVNTIIMDSTAQQIDSLRTMANYIRQIILAVENPSLVKDENRTEAELNDLPTILADYENKLKLLPSFYSLEFIVEEFVYTKRVSTIKFHPTSSFFNLYPNGVTGRFTTCGVDSDAVKPIATLMEEGKALSGQICFEECYGHRFLDPIVFQSLDLLEIVGLSCPENGLKVKCSIIGEHKGFDTSYERLLIKTNHSD